MVGDTSLSAREEPPEVDPARLPGHVAIIMDGNGRWARRRGLPRGEGHREGAESVRAVVSECARLGIKQLTLYALSTENWSRPKAEIAALMRIMKRFLVGERDEMMRNNIRLLAIGRLERFSDALRAQLRKSIELSRANTGMVLRMALNYGGRLEIADAARCLAERVRRGEIAPDDVTEETLGRCMYDPDMPPPDLLIRTGGESRISNFLLWHISYTELYFTPTCWPDFRAAELRRALASYAQRERRFGRVPEEPPMAAVRSG